MILALRYLVLSLLLRAFWFIMPKTDARMVSAFYWLNVANLDGADAKRGGRSHG